MEYSFVLFYVIFLLILCMFVVLRVLFFWKYMCVFLGVSEFWGCGCEVYVGGVGCVGFILEEVV